MLTALNKTNLSHYRGFTLIESLITLLILGIVSATFLPRFFSVSSYQQRVFFADVLAAIRYAQKIAVLTGCNVQVSITNNSYVLKRPAALDRSQCNSTVAAEFTRAIAHPGSSETSYSGSQSGISLTEASFYFNALGNASEDVEITVGGSKTIAVTKDTGFVYDLSS
jgi:MSHA pilin protein MshC